MTKRGFLRASALVAGLTFGIAIHAGDEPIKPSPEPTAATGKKPDQHIMMDHSIGDTKSMSKMKDKTVPIHKSGNCTPANSVAPVSRVAPKQ